MTTTRTHSTHTHTHTHLILKVSMWQYCEIEIQMRPRYSNSGFGNPFFAYSRPTQLRLVPNYIQRFFFLLFFISFSIFFSFCDVYVARARARDPQQLKIDIVCIYYSKTDWRIFIPVRQRERERKRGDFFFNLQTIRELIDHILFSSSNFCF